MSERSTAPAADASLQMIEASAQHTLAFVNPPLPRHGDVLAVIDDQTEFLQTMTQRVSGLVPQMGTHTAEMARAALAESEYRLRLEPGIGLQSACDHAKCLARLNLALMSIYRECSER